MKNNDKGAQNFFGVFYSCTNKENKKVLSDLFSPQNSNKEIVEIVERIFHFGKNIFLFSIIILILIAFTKPLIKECLSSYLGMSVSDSALFFAMNVLIVFMVLILQVPFAARFLYPLYYMLFYFHGLKKNFEVSCTFKGDFKVPVFEHATSFVIIVSLFFVGLFIDFALGTYGNIYRDVSSKKSYKFNSRIFLKCVTSILLVVFMSLFCDKIDFDNWVMASVVLIFISIYLSIFIEGKDDDKNKVIVINKYIIKILDYFSNLLNLIKGSLIFIYVKIGVNEVVGSIKSKYESRTNSAKYTKKFKIPDFVVNIFRLVFSFFPFVDLTARKSTNTSILRKYSTKIKLFKYASYGRWIRYFASRALAILFAISYMFILSYQGGLSEKLGLSEQLDKENSVFYWSLKGRTFTPKDLYGESSHLEESETKEYKFFVVLKSTSEFQESEREEIAIAFDKSYKNKDELTAVFGELGKFYPTKNRNRKEEYNEFLNSVESGNLIYSVSLEESNGGVKISAVDAKIYHLENATREIKRDTSIRWFSLFLFLLGFIFLWRKGGDYPFAFFLGISWATVAISLHYTDFFNVVMMEGLKAHLLERWDSYIYALPLAVISYFEIFMTLFNLANVIFLPLAIAFVLLLWPVKESNDADSSAGDVKSNPEGIARHFWQVGMYLKRIFTRKNVNYFLRILFVLGILNISNLSCLLVRNDTHTDFIIYERVVFYSIVNLLINLGLVAWGICLYNEKSICEILSIIAKFVESIFVKKGDLHTIQDSRNIYIPPSFVVAYIFLQIAIYSYFMFYRMPDSFSCSIWCDYYAYIMQISIFLFFLSMLYSIIIDNLFHILSIKNITFIFVMILFALISQNISDTITKFITDVSFFSQSTKYLFSLLLVVVFLSPTFNYVQRSLVRLTDPMSAFVKDRLKSKLWNVHNKEIFNSRIKSILRDCGVSNYILYTMTNRKMGNAFRYSELVNSYNEEHSTPKEKEVHSIALDSHLVKWLGRRYQVINRENVLLEEKYWFIAMSLFSIWERVLSNLKGDKQELSGIKFDYMIPILLGDEVYGLLFCAKKSDKTFPFRKSATETVSSLCLYANPRFQKK